MEIDLPVAVPDLFDQVPCGLLALDAKVLSLHAKIHCRYDTVDDEGNPITVRVESTPGRMMLAQWLYRNDDEASCSSEELIAWDAPITREDQEILEATDYDACVDTRRRVEFHMESDKPGLIMRKMLFELLQKHGEEEQFRPAGVPL